MAGGFETRVGYSADDIIETQWEADLPHARVFSEKLKARLLADPAFAEIEKAES